MGSSLTAKSRRGGDVAQTTGGGVTYITSLGDFRRCVNSTRQRSLASWRIRRSTRTRGGGVGSRSRALTLPNGSRRLSSLPRPPRPEGRPKRANVGVELKGVS